MILFFQRFRGLKRRILADFGIPMHHAHADTSPAFARTREARLTGALHA
jgi:hypothetical protein